MSEPSDHDSLLWKVNFAVSSRKCSMCFEAIATQSLFDASDCFRVLDVEFTSLRIDKIKIDSADNGRGVAVVEIEIAMSANLEYEDPDAFEFDAEEGKARKLPPRGATVSQIETLEAEIGFEYVELPLILKIGEISVSVFEIDQSLIRFVE